MPQHDHCPPVAIVTNSAFLAELARGAPNGTVLWVTSFTGSPDLTEIRNWFGSPYSGRIEVVDSWAERNTYFSVAALKPTADGEIRRRKANFARLLTLTLDDALLEDVRGQVSYVIETSPSKSQIGIRIDLADPDAANLPLVDALVSRLVERGLVRADSVRQHRFHVSGHGVRRPEGARAQGHRVPVRQPACHHDAGAVLPGIGQPRCHLRRAEPDAGGGCA